MAASVKDESEALFSERAVYIVKALSVFNVVVRNAFYFIFEKGCHKPHYMTVPEYLMKWKGMSRMLLKRYFVKSHLKKMEEDPTGKTFDLSLLYVCIQKACSNVADYTDLVWHTPSDTFEYTLFYLKQERNKLVHDSPSDFTDEMLKSLVEDVKKKLKILIIRGKEKFEIPDAVADDTLQTSTKRLDQILGSDLTSSQICNGTEKLRLSSETAVSMNGAAEVKRRSKSLTFIDQPVVVFDNENRVKVPVNDVFTDPELVEVQRNEESSTRMSTEYLLEKITQNDKKSTVILIEGDAGIGKTTLVKKLLSDWCSGNGLGTKLSLYELLLYQECRLGPADGFASLLRSQMPDTSCSMTSTDLLQSVLELKTLVIYDGLHELNHTPLALLNELFCNVRDNELFHKFVDNMQVLITTRPEKVESVYNIIPPSLNLYHAKITGISSERRVEFISKLGRFLKTRGQSGRGGKRKKIEHEVTGLITYFTTTPWLLDHFSRPVDLALFTLLWLQEGEKVQHLKTPTGLYNSYLKLMQDRVTERLSTSKAFYHLNADELRYRVKHFVGVVASISLDTLGCDSMILSEENEALLTETCCDLDLPRETIFHAFFSVEKIYSKPDISLKITFPHKSLQEYYAALAICNGLNQLDIKKMIRNVRKDFRKILQANSVPVGTVADIIHVVDNVMKEKLHKNPTVEGLLKDHLGRSSSLNLSKFRKVFIHVIGLLTAHSQLNDTLSSELVKHFRDSNPSDLDQWLDVITESECDRNVVSEVGKMIPKHTLCVRDGNLMAAVLLLQNQEDFTSVDLHVASDPNKLPQLKNILGILSSRETHLKVKFIHNWRYPELGSSDEYLESTTEKLGEKGGKLYQFTGSLKKLSSLGKRLELLQLAIGSRYANNQDRDADYMYDLVFVDCLCIHIVGGLPLDSLPLLPRKFLPVDLWFSDTHDSNVEWTGKAIRKLLGSNVYRPVWSIRFPRSKFSVDGCLKLAQRLKGIVIGESGVWVSSPNLSQNDAATLEVAFLQELNVKFSLSDEIKIWTF